MRSLWLLAPAFLTLTPLLPVQAAPIHDLSAQLSQSAIAPIEIKELVIRAQVAEVASPLQELFSDQDEQAVNEEIHLVVDLILTTLMQADRACENDEKTLDGACAAETILGRTSKSEMVQKVIVRGWDYKGKKSIAHMKELAAKPTMAGAREVLLGVLAGLLVEAREQGANEELLERLTLARAAAQAIEVENDETH